VVQVSEATADLLVAPVAGRRNSSDRQAGRRIPGWWRDACVVSAWGVLLVVTALWVEDGGLQDLSTFAAGLTSLGRITGLIASALLLLQVFAMARVPWVEQAWGQDELTRMHRLVGFSSFTLMLAHIVLITAGYASANIDQVLATIVELTLDYPGMLLAVAGTWALCMVVVTSLRAARRRVRYESWHLIHLYGYLGAALVLPHQLWTGQDFVKSAAATAFWWALYVVCAGSVVLFRIGLPLWRSLRAPIHVVRVRHHAPDVTTVTIGGPGVRKLRAQGGQFFQWRFLGAPGWSRAHPYSLSAAPNGTTLRFTAAVVGDGTARLADLRPGSRVLVEGPYGRMHSGTRTQRRVLLIGAGTGVTPLRALLESLPQRPGDVMFINRVRSRRLAVLGDEIENLAALRGADYRLVEGPRIPGRESWLPEQAGDWDDARALLHLCPDVAARDVFICGPPHWARAVRRAARQAAVPARQIHTESFQL
jgi:predicted ferric reductase